MRLCALILVSFLGLNLAQSQEVVRVTWPTAHAAPPATIPGFSAQEMAGLRLGMVLFSESNVVDLAAQQAGQLGLSAPGVANLRRLFSERYRAINHDAVFRNAASALPYCFSVSVPKEGLALVYRPKNFTSNSPVLIFLHGYGGSCLWSQQLLAETFPNYLTICPAFGIDSASMPNAYLSECLQAVRKKTGPISRRPVLMGLSAGGFGATRIYTRAPDDFSRLIVFAAYPPEETLSRFNRNMTVRFLAGADEDYVKSGQFNRYMQSIRSRAGDLEYKTIPGGDHFFMLAKKDESLKILRAWLVDTWPKRRP